MEIKVLEFSVNGINQKIEAILINEVFEKEGIRTTISVSGRKEITDKYTPDGKWVHKKCIDKNGNLDYEIFRFFDEEGKLISFKEEREDLKKTTFYEYDDHKNIVHHYTEILQEDGSAKKCDEFWYINFYDEKIDETKIKKNTICREFKNNLVVRFLEPGIEVRNEYDSENNILSMTTFENGKVVNKTFYYKSDDKMITVTKSENFEDDSIYYEIIDSRKTDKTDLLFATYYATEL